jgi:hypothetical protein
MVKVVFVGRKICCIQLQSSLLTENLPDQCNSGFYVIQTTINHFIMVYVKCFTILLHFVNSDLGLIRHTKPLIVLFGTVHSEDDHRR